MAAKNPRVNVVLEKPLYDNIFFLARKDHISVSQKIRDILKNSLEILEDIALEQIAEERAKTWNPKKAVSFPKAKKILGLR